MARVTENSLMGQIRELDAGQSFSRTTRVALGPKMETSTQDAMQKLRNLINQAVGRLRKEIAGSNFRVESAIGVTQDHGAALCTVAVTRMDDGEEEETDI